MQVVAREDIGPTYNRWHTSVRVGATNRYVSTWRASDDGGVTWYDQVQIDPSTGEPYDTSARVAVSMGYDPTNGKLVLFSNSTDTLTGASEGPLLTHGAVRYRVSSDGGLTWPWDLPVVVGGWTDGKPNPYSEVGKNGTYIGEVVSVPCFHGGQVLLPVCVSRLNPNGSLFNPYNTSSWADVFVLIGTWQADGTLLWAVSNLLKGDEMVLPPGSLNRTTRGVTEPSIALVGKGLLMTLRTSNEQMPVWNSRKAFSVSLDSGFTWGRPKVWTYECTDEFYSPSSCARLFTHSSGRVFWVGNVIPANGRGNYPRYPLVMGEVDPRTQRLTTPLLQLDTYPRVPPLPTDPPPPDSPATQNVVCSHVWAVEAPDGTVVVTYQRDRNNYHITDYQLVRVAI